MKKTLDEDYSEYKKRKKRLLKLSVPSPIKVTESLKPMYQIDHDENIS
jgi:hypothetical protein